MGLKFVRVSAHFILDVIAAIKQEVNKSRKLVQANFLDFVRNASRPISIRFFVFALLIFVCFVFTL